MGRKMRAMTHKSGDLPQLAARILPIKGMQGTNIHVYISVFGQRCFLFDTFKSDNKFGGIAMQLDFLQKIEPVSPRVKALTQMLLSAVP